MSNYKQLIVQSQRLKRRELKKVVTCLSPIEAEVDRPNSSEKPLSSLFCFLLEDLESEKSSFRFVKLFSFLRTFPENPKLFIPPSSSALLSAIPAEQTAPIFYL